MAVEYFRIYSLGLLFQFGYNIVSYVLVIGLKVLLRAFGLCIYISEYKCMSPLTISTEYRKRHGEQLSVWLLRQRRLYREKRFDLLTEERIQLLDEIGFQWQIQR